MAAAYADHPIGPARKNLSSAVGLLFCHCKAATSFIKKNISLKCPDDARLFVVLLKLTIWRRRKQRQR